MIRLPCFLLGPFLSISILYAEKGHFKEVDGTAAVEAESFWKIGGKMIVKQGSVGKTPKPMSGGAMFLTCEGRRSSSAQWKVDFSGTGIYKVYILASGQGPGGSNFGIFLGTEPNKLRKMSASQNCTSTQKKSCANYEVTVSDKNKIEWRGYTEKKSYQCISSRGCKAGNMIGKWDIKKPGTYLFGIHNGDEPFAKHGKSCNGKNDPSILIDKFVFTKGKKPSGSGPKAVLAGSSTQVYRSRLMGRDWGGGGMRDSGSRLFVFFPGHSDAGSRDPKGRMLQIQSPREIQLMR